MQELNEFEGLGFSRGASCLKEVLWRVVQSVFFNIDILKLYKFKAAILRSFGAAIEQGVVWKPKVKVTFPWRLKVGENSWLGEDVWLLNLANIEIGSNVCISQRTFLCTGSHDWKKNSFDLITQPIVIHDGVWICANVFIGPGVEIGRNSVVTAGSIVTKNLPPNMVCSGNPCVPIKPR
ncbi:WcaF family extracellular polysaccharide biosynthesis acetyltransferase [Vibrio cortegadensis]|uniref:WcaF family extracellular polysaccharide biosynthesis acetyltransferase n=1 Tax=Vibrio cortegadensis TaxID=1328770 RepID=UPI00352ECA50